MWVIVAVTMSFSGEPKLSVLPGPEYPTEAACVKATRVHGNFDSEHVEGSKFGFSFCVPKDSVQIGARAPTDAPKGEAHGAPNADAGKDTGTPESE
jgi:hypothetical protein